MIVRDAFVELYGEPGDPLPLEKWITWYGVFCSGWEANQATLDPVVYTMRETPMETREKFGETAED